MMKFKRKLMLFEDFETAQVTQTKVAKSVNTDSVATKVKSSDNIRTEVIADVDVILTNLEQLSAQILELNSVNEAQEDWMTKLIEGIKSSVAYAKLEAGLPTYQKLAQDANDNFITLDSRKALAPLMKAQEQFEKKKAEAKGEAKLAIIQKLEKIEAGMDKIKNSVELKKTAATNKLDTYKEKIKKDEDLLKGVIKELYDAKKLKVTRTVQEQGLLIKEKLANEDGNKTRAEAAKTEAKEIAAKQADLDKKIKEGTLDATDDLEEIKGIKPFLAEVTAMIATKEAADEVRKQIDTASTQFEAAQYSAFINDIMLAEDIEALFSGAKKDDKETAVENLKQTKKFADALAKVATEEWKAKKALYDKIKGTEVTKQIVQLAGGDGDQAEETEKGYKITALIQKWGDGTTFIEVDEYGDVKKSKEVLDQIDDAIAQAESGGKSNEDDQTKSAEEVAKDELGDEFDNYSKITDPEEEVEVTDDEGNTTTKKKWKDVKTYKGKDAEGADTDEEVIYAKEDSSESAPVATGIKLNEGMTVAQKFAILMSK